MGDWNRMVIWIPETPEIDAITEARTQTLWSYSFCIGAGRRQEVWRTRRRWS